MGHSKGRNTTLAGYFMDGPGFIGATGLICRPQDLAKWYESMGNLYKDPKTFDRVRYLEGSPLKSGNKGYSYGLQFDKPLIQHTGSTVGFVSASAYNPATGCVGVSFSDEETDFSTQPSVDTWLGIEQDYGDDEEPPPESSP